MNPYEQPEMEVIAFDSKDMITTSDGVLGEEPEDNNPGFDLPIVPN